MKKFVCVVLLVALAAGVCVGCKREPTPEEIWDSMVDHEKVEKFASQVTGNLYKIDEAAKHGDSYCAKCDKFIQGKVRICPHCGQYL